MKKFLLIAVITCICQLAFCQVKIEVADAAKHIGDTVTVCSKVFSVRGTEKVSFINLGAAFPNAPLTVVIFAKDRKNFAEAPEILYSGKNVCVTGKVSNYKGKPQINVITPEEITLQD